jgi:hypothetical protein
MAASRLFYILHSMTHLSLFQHPSVNELKTVLHLYVWHIGTVYINHVLVIIELIILIDTLCFKVYFVRSFA